MKKNLQAICGTLLIACMIFLSGCGSILARKANKNSTENTTSNEKPSEKPKGPKLAAPKPGAINITATELCREADQDKDKDKITFESKFRDKNIAVTGRVSSMSMDEDVSVYLEGGVGDCNLMVCRFEIDQFENLITLRKGKKVTLQGVGERFSVMPSLTECTLISIE